MELRHLDVLLAIAEEGSFTAAADSLSTVQSNVSEQVRQLEGEMGAQLLVRNRRGAQPTECGDVVLEHARRIRREIEAMRAHISTVQGLEVGEASLGIVGTASRWVVPPLVADLRQRAPGIRLRVVEAASERLMADAAKGELAQAVVTEPVSHPHLQSETLLEEALVAVVPAGTKLPRPPLRLSTLIEIGMVLPPLENPLRQEVELAAKQQGLELEMTVEVEGIRLVADLVAAGAGASVLPETAVPPELADVIVMPLAEMPPRRLALVTGRDTNLSLADLALRECLMAVVADRLRRVRR
ncbi:MAG: LysR substrate-binding domain-containing protein [Acidimicrobiia bacterium]|jgi:DNA-binding transcriptional LysR family regulator